MVGQSTSRSLGGLAFDSPFPHVDEQGVVITANDEWALATAGLHRHTYGLAHYLATITDEPCPNKP